MNPVVYDTGVLVAADRNDRRVWADHRVRLEAGIVPAVPAPVVAQASRSPSQVQLRRLLRGCEIVAMTEQSAHAAGHLLGRTGTADIADAAVASTAAEQDLRRYVNGYGRARFDQIAAGRHSTSSRARISGRFRLSTSTCCAAPVPGSWAMAR